MSTGNPYGLSEISHYGSMRNVGGKAGGFINKKFFHPSSLRNQEKLWKAITSDAAEKRKQDDLEKEMYLAGQSKSAMFTASASEGQQRGTFEQIKAHRELKRRKELLKGGAAAQQAKQSKEEEVELIEESLVDGCPDPHVKLEDEDDDDGGHAGASGPSASSRTLVRSKYPEEGELQHGGDVTVRGHAQIWGSWFTTEAQRWGYACCQVTDFAARCPHGPEEPEEENKEEKPRKKRKGRGGQAEVPAT